MHVLLYVFVFSLIGGIFSLIGGVLLLSKKKIADGLAAYAMPFSVGALIAAVFLDLLPDGLEEASSNTVLGAVMAGIVLFFFAERFLRWFHHHHQHSTKDPSIGLIIAGDTIHNAMDGVAIAAAFLISIPTGIVTTFAVAAHEIPQEIGDFGLMLAKGLRRRTVLLVNIVSAFATTLLALITYALGSSDKLPVGFLLGISAGFLLYIAMSDLIPTIHERSSHKKIVDYEPVLILLGIVLVALAIELAHHVIVE